MMECDRISKQNNWSSAFAEEIHSAFMKTKLDNADGSSNMEMLKGLMLRAAQNAAATSFLSLVDIPKLVSEIEPQIQGLYGRLLTTGFAKNLDPEFSIDVGENENLDTKYVNAAHYPNAEPEMEPEYEPEYELIPESEPAMPKMKPESHDDAPDFSIDVGENEYFDTKYVKAALYPNAEPEPETEPEPEMEPEHEPEPEYELVPESEPAMPKMKPESHDDAPDFSVEAEYLESEHEHEPMNEPEPAPEVDMGTDSEICEDDSSSEPEKEPYPYAEPEHEPYNTDLKNDIMTESSTYDDNCHCPEPEPEHDDSKDSHNHHNHDHHDHHNRDHHTESSNMGIVLTTLSTPLENTNILFNDLDEDIMPVVAPVSMEDMIDDSNVDVRDELFSNEDNQINFEDGEINDMNDLDSEIEVLSVDLDGEELDDSNENEFNSPSASSSTTFSTSMSSTTTSLPTTTSTTAPPTTTTTTLPPTTTTTEASTTAASSGGGSSLWQKFFG